MPIRFEVQSRSSRSRARAALLVTPHGTVPTPAFTPVGTQAAVKGIEPQRLAQLGARLVFANTYHLYLRPGSSTIAALGGLHTFMAWPHPLVTDSGGFQVFSLQELRRVDDDGVTFRSHLDGSEHRFTPERVMAIQEDLGADLIMAFDECPPPEDRDYNRLAMKRTLRWAERCLRAQTRTDQALFAVIQGGVFADLRVECARALRSLGFSGYAIGGLSVGETRPEMLQMLEATVPELPEDRPRHLLGVGAPDDFFAAVERGVDTMDCVLPTRLARNGAVLVREGRLNLRNARFKDDAAPIQDGCRCHACRHFSRAYLRHLLQAGEILGPVMCTIHNLHFSLDLMARIRQSILEGRFEAYRDEFLAGQPRWLARRETS